MKEGYEILKELYWNGGWKHEISSFWICNKKNFNDFISEESFFKAKQEGYMFDYPKSISHSETIERLKSVFEKISKENVASAFLYSLSSRKLEYRSALGSYWYAISIINHNSTNENNCKVCNWSRWKENPNTYDILHGLNVFNFERYMWGGVRHTNLNYVLFDLEQFIKLPKVIPSEDDYDLLNKLLKCTNELESHNKAGKYRECLTKKKIIKSTKDELGTLIDILGICGVLSSDEHPCYAVKFTPNDGSRDPLEYYNDFVYPVNRWKISDGINKERFKEVFGFDFE